MSRFNIFRNPIIDTQVSMLMDTFDLALRRQTEEYWRNEIARQIFNRCPDVPVCDDCLLTASFVRRGADKGEWY